MNNCYRGYILIAFWVCSLAVYGQTEMQAIDTLRNIRLQEVIVTATQSDAPGTRSVIGQDAIRHIQATDLSVLSQLLPGVLVRNPDLNAPAAFTIRSATYENTTNALGTAIVVDGLRMNNNANMQQMGLEGRGSLFNSTVLSGFLSVAILREELPYYCLPGDNRAGERLRTQAVYHPLIENCIPNDMVLHEKSALITGSNMAGKTCFMRTIGVNLLAAKTLHTCFAEVFEINTGISLLSSIHQGDNLMENKSYFMQEVTTIKDFVDESGHGNHLFLLDELFRGTNTKERIAISKAVLSWLVKSDNLVFVSTHDLELADMLEDEYELYYFSESVKDGILSFDYKLKRGVATEHNAIKILEICDYPASLVSEAHSITSI